MRVLVDYKGADPMPLPNTKLVMALSYGDKYSTSPDGVPDVIRYLGLTLEHLVIKSNFRHNDYYTPTHRWGAVSNFYYDVPYDYVMSLQDNPGVVENWLIGDTTDGSAPARPLWWAINNSGARVLRCGTSAFGGNPILIKTHANGDPIITTFFDSYPTGFDGRQDIQFYQVVGMPKSMIGSANHTDRPYWIQIASQAQWNGKEDAIDWNPKGETIYYPVFSFSDWTVNMNTEIMYFPVKGTMPLG